MNPITFTVLLLIPLVLGQSAGNCGFPGFGETHCIGNHYSVANRRAGSISVVNPQSLAAVNVKLPDDGEPMHITTFEIVEKGSCYAELWVDDRNNSRLEIYRMADNDLQYNGFIPINGGAFRAMSTELYPQVRRPLPITTCDITKVVLVHDMITRQLECKFETPSNATLTITLYSEIVAMFAGYSVLRRL